MTTTYDRERGGHVFRQLGDPSVQPQVGTCHPWFVTAHTTAWVVDRGVVVECPSSVVHAKRMGSTATACGIPATTWRKLWSVEFRTDDRDVCEACRAHVRTTARGAGRP